MRINFSKDVLLNSKGEYGGNSVSGLTVQKDAWERRERGRQEEELEELNKKKVEEFRKMKSLQCVQHTPDPPSGMHTARGEQTGHYPGSHCTSLGPTGQGDSLTQDMEYETDDEEFGGGQDTQNPPSGMHTAGGEQTGHYPGSHCTPLGPTGQGEY